MDVDVCNHWLFESISQGQEQMHSVPDKKDEGFSKTKNLNFSCHMKIYFAVKMLFVDCECWFSKLMTIWTSTFSSTLSQYMDGCTLEYAEENTW